MVLHLVLNVLLLAGVLLRLLRFQVSLLVAVNLAVDL